MNYFKILFRALIIFSLSSFLFSQEKEAKEERELKFPGYTLSKCLKGYDIAKQPKRRVAKLPSQKAQKYLKRLYPTLEEDNLILALEILNEMKVDEALNNVDKAQMWYYFCLLYTSPSPRDRG